MQLPAPSEGFHPGESGASCLEYLLEGAETVPASMGLFLPLSYRMHPALCSLVSELSYSGKLRPHASAAERTVVLAPPAEPAAAAGAAADSLLTRGAGVSFVAVEHQGNTHAAPEEAAAIGRLCDELLRASLRDAAGGNPRERPLRAEDILVVAPYNLQVRTARARPRDSLGRAPLPVCTLWPTALPRLCPLQVRLLAAAVPRGVRVGTVDRFQGQEAPVVLVSLCHSDFGDGLGADAAGGGGGFDGGGGGVDGRGLSFVLNQNRLNVALSRAQCLAVVVGSAALADTPARTLQQQRELNTLCRVIEASED